MSNKAKQRFVDLSVGEVSLVDSPANQQEFVVVKRLNQEEGDMADVNTEVKKAEGVTEPVAKDSNQAAPEKVQVEVAKATNAAVEKAMAQVTELVESIAKATGTAPEPSEASGEANQADVEKGKMPDMRGMYKGQLEKAGVKGEALEKAMADFDKKMPPFMKPEKKGVQKDTDGAGEAQVADDAEASVQKMLEVLAVGVQKAKAFTPKREAALKAAIETLSGLMKELAMQDIPVGGSPSTSVPSGASFGASDVVELTKSLTELKDILKAKLDEVHEVTKSLGERLQTIEKTRNPSTSLEGEGGTDTQETKKSFWANVL